MIEIRGCSKAFGTLMAVSKVSLEIGEREVFGLVGSNGAGKSTLLRMIAGILKPDEGEIKITVKEAEDDQNDILMIVEDNGVGMSEEQCRKILCKERSDSSGIGVKNVNDRLKIYFGEKYGLTVKSELDVGTVMTARIPKIAKEEQNEN